jgi:hypothetical protein
MFTQDFQIFIATQTCVRNTRTGLLNNKQSGSVIQLIYKVNNSGFHPKDWQSRIISIFHSPEKNTGRFETLPLAAIYVCAYDILINICNVYFFYAFTTTSNNLLFSQESNLGYTISSCFFKLRNALYLHLSEKQHRDAYVY